MPLSSQGALLRDSEVKRDLGNSDEFFRCIIDASPTAMIVIDETGEIELVNLQAERVFGYDRSELLGKSVEALVPGRYKTSHATLRTSFVKAPEARAMGLGRDLYGLRKDGTEFPIEIGLGPVETGQGMKVIATIVDLSERKQRTLDASYLAAIVDSSSDGIIGKNLDGIVTFWNPAAERLFGYGAAEMIGRNISTLIPPERIDEENVILTRIRNGERVEHFETVRQRNDGSKVAVSITVSPIRGARGEIVGASKIVRDITERQHAAESLRLSEERFRSIFGAIVEGVFVTDASGVLVDVNEPGNTMFGYVGKELVGANIETLSSGVHPYTMAEALQWLEKAANSGRSQSFDWHCKRKDGSLFWGEISLQLASIGGCRVGLAIVRDVTERRTMEAQLRQALKMEAIGTLAGGVAHELNNLLQPIIMTTELVMADLSNDNQHSRQLSHVVDAGLKATEIVQRILAFGRADEVSHQLLDFSMIVREGISFVRTIIPASIALRVNVADSVGSIRGDKTQLTQVLINLATNARDAIGPGVGTLTVSLSKLQEDVTLSDSRAGLLKCGSFAVLTVKDTGAGMDADTAQRIFEPFFTTKGVGKGTGLGLSVTHGIIAGHGGEIRVSSTPGEGTCFAIYLPLAEESVNCGVA